MHGRPLPGPGGAARPPSCIPYRAPARQPYLPIVGIKGTAFAQLEARVGGFAAPALCLTRPISPKEAKLVLSRAKPGERVAEGLRVLSPVVPPWWCMGGENEIDPDTLDMADPLRSLLGQRFGSLQAGLTRLGLTEDDAIACGFAPVDAEDAIQLRRLWLINLISSRVESRAALPLVDRPAGPAGGPRSRWYL